MKRTETRRSALKAVEPKPRPSNAPGWQKVFDGRNRRVRGLWLRNGVYHAQLNVAGIAVWVGHRDRGILIGKVYGHLRPGHSANEAKKLGAKAWN